MTKHLLGSEILEIYFDTYNDYEPFKEYLKIFISSRLKSHTLDRTFRVLIDKNSNIHRIGESMAGLIDSGINWAATPEGFEFWSKVNSDMRRIGFSDILLSIITPNRKPEVIKKGTKYLFKTVVEDEGDQYELNEDSEFLPLGNNEYKNKQGERGYYFERS